MVARDTPKAGLRLLVTVTFNPNQLRAHLLPLIELDEVDSITLVSDVEPPPLPKVEAVVPSAKAVRVLGRAGAKLALCLWLARRSRFDWIIGFNFVPHGFNAQLVGRLTGTRSMYHMIGGELEWRGGGHGSENGLLGRLPRSVPLLEGALLRQIRGATVVATMGPRGRETLIAAGVDPTQVLSIPPAVDPARLDSGRASAPMYDFVTVGRLSPLKRTDDLLVAAARLHEGRPGLRVGIAGAGPLREQLLARRHELGLDGAVELLGQVEAVEELYGHSRAFVLTSAFEGMPIAMLDAMAAALPVAVSDVGEISTLVRHGENGLLQPAGDVDRLTENLRRLLDEPRDARELGAVAAREVREQFSIAAVSELYRGALGLREASASRSRSFSTVSP